MAKVREYSPEGLMEILNTLPLAVAVLDESVSLVLVNKTAQKYTGKEEADLLGRLAGDVLGCVNQARPMEDCGLTDKCSFCNLRQALETTLKNRTPQSGKEITLTLENVGERLFKISTLPIKLAGELGVLLAMEDITEIRAHEQVRIEREKLAAVLETTGGVCHELSQPLQVIMGYCEILADHEDLDPEVQEAVSAIAEQADKLAQLTHSLTRVTQYKTKPYLTSRIIDIEKSAGS